MIETFKPLVASANVAGSRSLVILVVELTLAFVSVPPLAVTVSVILALSTAVIFPVKRGARAGLGAGALVDAPVEASCAIVGMAVKAVAAISIRQSFVMGFIVFVRSCRTLNITVCSVDSHRHNRPLPRRQAFFAPIQPPPAAYRVRRNKSVAAAIDMTVKMAR